jgi:hypothetical protein
LEKADSYFLACKRAKYTNQKPKQLFENNIKEKDPCLLFRLYRKQGLPVIQFSIDDWAVRIK